MTAKRHIAFLETNLTSGLEALRLARDVLDCRVTLITADSKRHPAARLADDVLAVTDASELKSLLEPVLALHDRAPFDALITFSEYHVVAAAQLASHLGLASLSLDAARACRNKYLQRAVFSRAGLAQPAYALAMSRPDAEEAIAGLRFPLFVKPVDARGARHARAVACADELALALGPIFKQEWHRPGVRAVRAALIEELVEGEVVTVEVLTSRGRHHVLGISAGSSFPIHHERKAEILRSCTTALDALGFDHGPSRTDLIVGKDGPVVLEVNPVLAEGFMPPLIDYVTGTRVVADVLRLALGEEPVYRPPAFSGVATAVAAFAGAGDAFRAALSTAMSTNSQIKRLELARKGLVIARGATRAEAESLSAQVCRGLRISFLGGSHEQETDAKASDRDRTVTDAAERARSQPH